jgi:hypothetical protein
MCIWYNKHGISCAGGSDSLRDVAPHSGGINYWISAVKRKKKFIIAAL